MSKLQKTNKNRFRWWQSDPEALTKLRQAFLIGCSDKEACVMAGITERQLYYFQTKYPAFVSEKNIWKKYPEAKARLSVFNNLDKPKVAMWYLEKTCPEEFGKQVVLAKPRATKINFVEEAMARRKII